MTISSLCVRTLGTADGRPLKLTIGIRDFWDNADSDVSRAKAALKASMGLDARICIDWGIVLDELDELYDDHRVLASSMAGFAAAWLTSFTALAEAEEETLGRQVVDTVLGRGTDLEVDFKVSGRRDSADGQVLHDASDARTAWNDLTGRFTLMVPRRQVLFPFESIPSFTRQLTQTFEPELDTSRDSADPLQGEQITAPPQPVGHQASPAAAPRSPSRPAAQQVQARLPKRDASADPLALPDPEALLQQPPYYLTLCPTASNLEVACSNSATLLYLEHYLSHWSAASRVLPNGLSLQLHACPLRQGLYDRLTISAHDRPVSLPVSLPVIAAIVQRSLGYELQHSCGTWTFIRTTAFL